MKGYRFHPTDEELVDHFLRHKNLGHEDLVEDAITEINFYHFDPRDLPGLSRTQSYDQVWYFFSTRASKYPKGRRANRKTENGYWKVTGRDRKIKGKNQEVIGTKKTLVFYRGRAGNGVRTGWVMHEYFGSSVSGDQGAYVICKVKYKLNGKVSISCRGGAENSHPPASNPEDHVGTKLQSKANIQAEETPESLCAFSSADGDLSQQWSELDNGITSLDFMLPPEFSFIDEPLGSEFGLSLKDLEVANGVDSQFANSLFANLDDSSFENNKTLLESMQSESAAKLNAVCISSIDAGKISSCPNQYSPINSFGEYPFDTE